MQNDKLKTLFDRRFKAGKEYRKPFETKWERLTNFYHLIDPDHKWNFVPFLKPYADSIGVRWEAGIFAGRQFFGLKGRPSKFDDAATKMASVIQYQAEEENGLLALLRGSMTPLSYLGNVILKAEWQSSPEAPGWSDVSLLDFWPRPRSSGINDKLGWCIVRGRYTLRELRELEEGGVLQDIDNIVNHIATSKNDNEKQGEDMTLEARGVSPAKIDEKPTADDKDREYTVYQMWEKNRCFTIEENSKEIISVPDMPTGVMGRVLDAVGLALDAMMDGWTKNDFVDDMNEPYFPFVLLRPRPEKGIFYGLSPVEPLLDLQVEFNENRHLKRETTDIIKKGIWLVRRGCNIDDSRLETASIIKGDSITTNDINRLDVGGPELVGIFERDEDRITLIGDRESGIFDPQRGGGEGGVTKTVGGLTLLLKEGNLKFARDIANIQTDGIKNIAMMCVWLNQQFLEDEKEVTITGKTMTVPADELQGIFRVEAISAPGLGQQEAEQVMYGELVAFYRDDPSIKIDELKKRHLKASNIDPIDAMWTTEEQDIIAENQQLMADNAAMQEMIAQAQAGQQQGKPPAVPEPAQPMPEPMMV